MDHSLKSLERIETMDAPIRFSPVRTDRKALLERINKDITQLKQKPHLFDVREYVRYIDVVLLDEIIESKKIFDNYTHEEIECARRRSNPYELIGSAIFMNRAAVKIAEIDSRFNWPITQPPCLSSSDPLFFGDLCGGCGGFTEYILWRSQWKAKGFGLTLKNEDVFKPYLVSSNGPAEMFQCYYGPANDGDITKLENIQDFYQNVSRGTHGHMLHCVVADGGFSVRGNENEQELLSRELYFYQVLCALRVLRQGGNFVCKFFDISTPFTASLLYILQKAFRNFCIYKPLTSRPANAERYVVCIYRMDDDITNPILNYLMMIAAKVSKHLNNNLIDMHSLCPISLFESDRSFINYLKQSIDRQARMQLRFLEQLRHYVNNSKLTTPQQNEFRQRLLRSWKIPDRKRKYSNNNKQIHIDIKLFYKDLIRLLSKEFLFRSPLYHKECQIKDSMLNKSNNGICYVTSMGRLELIVGFGNQNVISIDLTSYPDNLDEILLKKRIPLVTMLKGIVLPEKTVLLAEKVPVTFIDKDNGYIRQVCHYIMDAFVIGSENLFADCDNLNEMSDEKQLSKRHEQIHILLNALHDTPLRRYTILSRSKANQIVKTFGNDLANMISTGKNQYAPFYGFRTVSTRRNVTSSNCTSISSRSKSSLM